MLLIRDSITSVDSGSILWRPHGGLLAMTSERRAARIRTDGVVTTVAVLATSKRTGAQAKALENQSVDPPDRRHDSVPKWVRQMSRVCRLRQRVWPPPTANTKCHFRKSRKFRKFATAGRPAGLHSEQGPGFHQGFPVPTSPV